MQEKTEFDFEKVERNLDGVVPSAEIMESLCEAWRKIGDFLLPYRNGRFYSKGALQRLFVLRWLTDPQLLADFNESTFAEKIGVRLDGLNRDIVNFRRRFGFRSRNIKSQAA